MDTHGSYPDPNDVENTIRYPFPGGGGEFPSADLYHDHSSDFRNRRETPEVSVHNNGRELEPATQGSAHNPKSREVAQDRTSQSQKSAPSKRKWNDEDVPNRRSKRLMKDHIVQPDGKEVTTQMSNQKISRNSNKESKSLHRGESPRLDSRVSNLEELSNANSTKKRKDNDNSGRAPKRTKLSKEIRAESTARKEAADADGPRVTRAYRPYEGWDVSSRENGAAYGKNLLHRMRLLPGTETLPGGLRSTKEVAELWGTGQRVLADGTIRNGPLMDHTVVTKAVSTIWKRMYGEDPQAKKGQDSLSLARKFAREQKKWVEGGQVGNSPVIDARLIKLRDETTIEVESPLNDRDRLENFGTENHSDRGESPGATPIASNAAAVTNSNNAAISFHDEAMINDENDLSQVFDLEQEVASTEDAMNYVFNLVDNAPRHPIRAAMNDEDYLGHIGALEEAVADRRDDMIYVINMLNANPPIHSRHIGPASTSGHHEIIAQAEDRVDTSVDATERHVLDDARGASHPLPVAFPDNFQLSGEAGNWIRLERLSHDIFGGGTEDVELERTFVWLG